MLSFILGLLLAVTPPAHFECDGDYLKATIRNNLNGDFSLVNDLEAIDKGAFIVLDWKEISLMLPVSFQSGQISFTDKKWLWSYKDNKRGLHLDAPRLSQIMPNGQVLDYDCSVT